MEPVELPGPAGDGDLAGGGHEIEYDLPERRVAVPGVEDEVSVQRGSTCRLVIDDPRAVLDRPGVTAPATPVVTAAAIAATVATRSIRPVMSSPLAAWLERRTRVRPS